MRPAKYILFYDKRVCLLYNFLVSPQTNLELNIHECPSHATLLCVTINCLSMNALTVKAGSWGNALTGRLDFRMGMSWTLLNKTQEHQSVDLSATWCWKHFPLSELLFKRLDTVSELNLCCLYRRPCQRGNPQPNKCLIHVGDAHKLISGKLHINMPPLLNRPLGFYSGGGATAIQVEKMINNPLQTCFFL